jgi:hypothetical protein
VNGFGPAHIEKSHFKGIFGCIFRQSLIKYGGNKSIKESYPLLKIAKDVIQCILFICVFI